VVGATHSRSHTNSFLLIRQAASPSCDGASDVCGRPSAIRRTSSQVAMVGTVAASGTTALPVAESDS
jgi:hypothetical protein